MFEIKPIFSALLRSKTGPLLLLIQIAVTTAIVSNAAFIVQDRLSYLQQETGYPEQDIFSFVVATFGDERDISAQFERDEAMLRKLPGVADAALFSSVPLSGSGSNNSFSLKPAPEDSKSANSSYIFVDEHGLSTLGVSLLEGRNFYPEEVVVGKDYSIVPKVVIATKAFTDELFPDGEALGKVIYMGDRPLQIVGIAQPMKSPWLKSGVADRVLLIPMIKAESFSRMVVRAESGQREQLMQDIEQIMLNEYDKRVIQYVEGLDQMKADYNAGDVLMMRMLIVLIIVLVGVTVLGIFGLTLFNISKRTRQIGTRRALGARKSAIVRYFLVENSLVCLLGLIPGCIGALLLAHQLMTHYSVPSMQTSYVVVTAIIMVILSLLAAWFPARRAANISPSIATRSV